MNTVQEIKQAVERLDPSALAEFRAWFTTFDADAWDRQIERDVDAGKLNVLAAEALADLRASRSPDM